MNLNLQGKIALVAAGTRGIGYATARSLAAEGAIVSLCGNNPDNVAHAQKELGSQHRAYKCDLTQTDDIAHWISSTTKDLGTPSILVTNSGGPPAGNLESLSDQQWQQGFESTLMNIVRMCNLVTPMMKEKRFGRIVHITSLVAKDPYPLLTISSTLRAGISSLCRIQAKELGQYGITANCVLPGHTETERQYHLLELRAQKNNISFEEARNQAAASIPLKRLAVPDEIAHAITFLCSAQASYITGAQLVVDGGESGGLG